MVYYVVGGEKDRPLWGVRTPGCANIRAGASQRSRSMLRNPTQTENSIDTNRRFIGTQHKYLGRDRDGYHHHADESRGLVYRFDDEGQIERVTDLFEHPNPEMRHLDSYIDFVAEGRGWEDRRIIKAEAIFAGFRP